MDLSVKPEYRQFREEVRDFLNESLTDDIREAGRLGTSVFHDKERAMAWQKILHAKCWAAPHWPKQYGGTGWDVVQRSIFAEESLKADAPQLIPMGLHMCGPCIIGCGTDEQKEYFLPRLAYGTLIPCFGLTGPHSGSDATSLIGSDCVVEQRNGELGVRASFKKRYITLAPIAGVVGLGLNLSDPEGLLGEKGSEGFTVALLE